MWTREAMHALIQERLCDYKLIVVANREPYVHRFDSEGQIECIQPASGVTTAVGPIIQTWGGVWVAHGSGSADRLTVDEFDRVQVPPDEPAYTLRRVWLSEQEEEGYYYGLANSGLWPLCHITFTRPIFEPAHWQAYREVNQRFAAAVLEEADGKPAFVFVQDYHFGLLPRMLKEANPSLIVAQFWHIPWPNRETFRVFPWKEELLDGLLGNDLLGFHLRYHCQNFLETVDRTVEAMVDQDHFEVTRGGKSTLVRPFPISIDFDTHDELARSPRVERRMEAWRRRLRADGKLVGVGIERADYTKGIPERLRALDRFLEANPQWQGRLVFAQVGVPSRMHIAHYQALESDIQALVQQINDKWRSDDWQPIEYFQRHYDPPDMMALHRLADFFIVSSLHDGMNLVAKEFIASRSDYDGVLILSQFAGAARELTDALLVNPFSVEELAGAIQTASEMAPAERRHRMQKLRDAVAGNNIYRWAGKVVSALLKFDLPESALATADSAPGV